MNATVVIRHRRTCVLVLCLLLTFLGSAAGQGGPEQLADKQARQDLYGDALPEHALARLGTIRYRHSGPYKRLAFLSDNRTLIVGTKYGAFRLWDAATGKLVREIDDAIPLQAFAVSKDGHQLAC